jgi:hypothetical protein
LQSEVLQLVAGILHLGNVLFAEVGSETAAVHLDESEFFYFIKIYLLKRFLISCSTIIVLQAQVFLEQ